jgi:hypothetical protein
MLAVARRLIRVRNLTPGLTAIALHAALPS